MAWAFPTVWRRGESLAEDIMAALKLLEVKIGATLTVEGERALPTHCAKRKRERDQQDMKKNEKRMTGYQPENRNGLGKYLLLLIRKQ